MSKTELPSQFRVTPLLFCPDTYMPSVSLSRLLHTITAPALRGLTHHPPTQSVLDSSSPNPSQQMQSYCFETSLLAHLLSPSGLLFSSVLTLVPAESVRPCSVFTAMFVGGASDALLYMRASDCAKTHLHYVCLEHEAPGAALPFATVELVNVMTSGTLGSPVCPNVTFSPQYPTRGLVQSWLTKAAWHGSCTSVHACQRINWWPKASPPK